MKKETYNQLVKKITDIESILNGGPGSGNFGHGGRPGKVGGSSKSSGIKGMGAMDEGIKSYNPDEGIDGGFTVDIKKGQAYKLGESDGYAVGGFGTELVIDQDVYKDKKKRRKIIRDYVKKNLKALQEEGACLGGWVPSSNENGLKGKLVLDVSRVFKSKKEAVKAAIETDQDSITDFKGFSWPETKDLAKEFGLEKEYKKIHGLREKERKNT